MNKWSNAAKVRLVEIQSAEEATEDMRSVASAIALLPPGQIKKVLSEDIIQILAKYGVVIE